MKLRSPQKSLMIFVGLLTLFTLIGGCVSDTSDSPTHPESFETDAWCEIQEFNLTIIHNRTIVPITEDDLRPYPEFGRYISDGNNTPPVGNSGFRVVRVIDCNASRAIGFLTLSRKFEEFPNQPVLEYRGRYFKVSFEYRDSHSTARPTKTPVTLGV